MFFLFSVLFITFLVPCGSLSSLAVSFACTLVVLCYILVYKYHFLLTDVHIDICIMLQESFSKVEFRHMNLISPSKDSVCNNNNYLHMLQFLQLTFGLVLSFFFCVFSLSLCVLC